MNDECMAFSLWLGSNVGSCYVDSSKRISLPPFAACFRCLRQVVETI